jgi:glycyl-tRNA synthetase (class II)
MDSREYYYAMLAWRELNRARSREAFELARFGAYLDQLVDPWVKNKLKEPKDVIKFMWELEKKQPLEEMKETLKAIAGTNFSKPEPAIRTSPPVSGRKKMKRTKFKRK